MIDVWHAEADEGRGGYFEVKKGLRQRCVMFPWLLFPDRG